MSAREMFEKLGYKLINTKYIRNTLITAEYSWTSKLVGTKRSIIFGINDYSVEKLIDDEFTDFITGKELKAINKFYEEQGWEE